MREKIKIVVNGASGKMGRQVIQCALADGGFQLVGAVEKVSQTDIGKDAGEKAGVGPVGVKIVSDLEQVIKNAEVVIDFTAPESSLAVLDAAYRHKVGLVVGTTGFSEAEDLEFEKKAQAIACVKAPNMSIGVNLLFKLVEEAAKVLKEGYDIEIVEAHHRLKKDAPSGTAKGIVKAISRALGRNVDQNLVSGRSGMVGERRPQEIGVLAVRGGDIVGDHTVMFAGQGERLELVHRAHSRETFAVGALKAARFVVKAKPGLYSMQDVLGIL